eukprot:2066509-Prymnesium_polylepis.1
MVQALGARQANALISYNNYAASASVPMLQEAVAAGDALQTSGLGAALRSGGVAAAYSAADALRVVGSVGAGLSREMPSDLESLGRGLGANLGVDLGGLGAGLDSLGARVGAGLGLDGGRAGGPMGEQLADGLRSAAAAVGALGDQAEAAASGYAGGSDGGGDGGSTDFSPSPEETDALVSRQYAVGRNLLLRFIDDSLDQSMGLAQLLKVRFTDAETGI